MDERTSYAAALTKAQKRLLLAMSARRPKKWRAVYRHAKVRGWTQLPFALARPTLTGSEMLTDLGRAVRAYIQEQHI